MPVLLAVALPGCGDDSGIPMYTGDTAASSEAIDRPPRRTPPGGPVVHSGKCRSPEQEPFVDPDDWMLPESYYAPLWDLRAEAEGYVGTRICRRRLYRNPGPYLALDESYQYDAQGRLTRYDLGGDDQWLGGYGRFFYDADGHVTRFWYGNGHFTEDYTITYDERGLRDEVVLKDSWQDGDTYTRLKRVGAATDCTIAYEHQAAITDEYGDIRYPITYQRDQDAAELLDQFGRSIVSNTYQGATHFVRSRHGKMVQKSNRALAVGYDDVGRGENG